MLHFLVVHPILLLLVYFETSGVIFYNFQKLFVPSWNLKHSILNSKLFVVS